MSQNNLDPNATNTEVTDTEILTFYNLATMTLLTSLEVRNEINAMLYGFWKTPGSSNALF